MAAKLINQANASWLGTLRGRLLDATDFSNASSAFGEIRAYGALLEAGMTVQPAPIVPNRLVSPEFEAAAGDGPVIVDVHSRQMTPSEAVVLAAHQAAIAVEVEKAVAGVQKARDTSLVIVSRACAVASLGGW